MLSRRIFLCGLAGCAGTAIVRGQGDVALPADFGKRAMVHVRNLAIDPRVAGTAGERRAVRYMAQQFRRAGLAVAEEPFTFRNYSLRSARIACGGREAQLVRLVFDPYADTSPIEGQVAIFDPAGSESGAAFADLDLNDKIVVTLPAANFYRLLPRRPRAIAYVSPEDFDGWKTLSGEPARLAFDGVGETRTSANLVGSQPGHQEAEEILVTAHLDSVRTFGANDNASGVAVMTELIGPLLALDLPVRLRFVCFGAEEPGMIGSRIYLREHLDEVRRCRLVFNFDSVGGPGPLQAETSDGVRGIPPEIGSQLPPDMTAEAWADIDERWSLLRPEQLRLYASDVPPWLQAAIAKAGEASGGDYLPGREMGSDHLTFAQAGIVATDVAIGGGARHTLEDIPANVHPSSLEQAGRFALQVIRSAAMRTA